MGNQTQDDLTLRKQARAYELWEKAGRPAGRDLDYWLQAESELSQTSQMAAAMAPPPKMTLAPTPAPARKFGGLRSKKV